MKCQYLYKTGDQLVILGKKIIGEDCRSNGATDANGGLCPGHALQMGTMSAEKKAAGYAKLKESRRNRKNGKRDKKEKIGQELKAGPIAKREINHEVLEAMGLNSQCDLEYEFKVFVATNPRPGVENWNEKMAFARWLESPEHLRVPPTLDEAAVVLGVSVRALGMWKTSPEILNFINDDLRLRACGLYKLALYNMGDGMARGDKGLTDTYLKHLNEIKDIAKGKGSVLKDVPKEMQKEADEYGALIKQQNIGTARKSEKTLLNSNYFNGTLTPGPETEQ